MPWHRFALKLHLQHLNFTLVDKPIPGVEAEESLYEHYEEGLNSQYGVYGTLWAAQTFTPEAHLISRLELLLAWSDNPAPLVIVSIKETNPAGHPTGDDLTSAEFDPSVLPEHPTYAWHSIPLTPYQLQGDTKYAIVCRAPGGGGTKITYWKRDSVDATYANGNHEYSYDSGSMWSAYLSSDLAFREFGTGIGEPPVPGLLHVRHPAIKSFSQKRKGIIVRADDDLSSLDDQYLTKQVGLDVHPGDEIEATTVAGILYKHLV
ncbi:hypothetical protein ES703_67658 [subsurface metagenome]